MRRTLPILLIVLFAILSTGADSCSTDNTAQSGDKAAQRARKKEHQRKRAKARKRRQAAVSPPVISDPAPPKPNCDPNYSGQCLDPNSSDYDCAGGSGDGPDYVYGPIQVVGSDPYDLDRDGDGVACDAG